MVTNGTGPRGPSKAAPLSAEFPSVEIVPLTTIRPNPRNARTHSRKQIKKLAAAMKQFGVINPIVVDESGTIYAGHARAEAAKLLGLSHVPVVRPSHLSETEMRAYMLADNKLATLAGWDPELLGTEFADLQIRLPEAGLDLDITGFEPGEIDLIMSDLAEDNANSADDLSGLDDAPVANSGDLFVLGRHRIIVGDARDEETYERLLGSEKAAMAFLDPPYNVKVNGHVGGRGKIKHPEFAEASGEMNSDQFVQFLKATLGQCARHTIDGAITYVCMDWRHASDLLKAGAAVYDDLKNICVWSKSTPGQGSFYRSQHEFVFVYKTGTAPHINTFELGQHGRSRSNVWSYPGANSFRAGRINELKMHPTVKPVALIADAMRDCSRRGSIILDAFAGSGSTIAAAEKVGRRAFCVEIAPPYADVAIRRWQRITGKDAILKSTEQTFDDLSELRKAAPQKIARKNK